MIDHTTPVFILSSGRSGTQMVDKLLKIIPEYESHHEFLCTHVQPLAARYFMGLISRDEVLKALREVYVPAVHYSSAKFFADSSNKLSWLIDPLFELFPGAKFIHLVRDGRKVVSSYFHKLGDEIYDDVSVHIMREWLKSPDRYPMPPPEKKYWWNIPQPGQPFAEEFPTFSQLQRIAYHWVEINRAIDGALPAVPPAQQLLIRLEDLVSYEETVRELLQFLEVHGHQEQFVEMLKRPHNVNIPRNFYLSPEQSAQFWAIAGATMARFRYEEKEEYAVTY